LYIYSVVWRRCNYPALQNSGEKFLNVEEYLAKYFINSIGHIIFVTDSLNKE
jgi:hypothetical protein